MNDNHHAMWVALAMARGVDVNGFPWGQCDYDGWWRCEPGYNDSTSADPLALFTMTRPENLESGDVSGLELLQHLSNSARYAV